MTAKIDLAVYKERYSFTTKPIPPDDQLVQLEEDIRLSKGWPARQHALKSKLRFLRLCRLLSAEPASIASIKRETNYFKVYDPSLYIGGLRTQIIWQCMTDRRFSYHKSIYTGPLPEWVDAKARLAKKYFRADELVVVSKNPAFFSTEDIVNGSPLLLGFYRGEIPLLLAAWGMEYELPKSLGGLLPDELPLTEEA